MVIANTAPFGWAGQMVSDYTTRYSAQASKPGPLLLESDALSTELLDDPEGCERLYCQYEVSFDFVQIIA